MAARARGEPSEGATVLPFERRGGRRRPGAGRRVLAVILDDGTVRPVGAAGEVGDDPFAVGQLSGDGWILWWQRRSFD